MTITCPKCGFDNLSDAHYCGMCGTRLIRICPSCATPNPQTYRYCHRCGIALTASGHQESTSSASSYGNGPGSQIVAPSGAGPRDGSTTDDTAPLAGERRVATVILADVQGSTDLFEKVGTEAWVALMNRVFRVLEAEIYRYGGKVDQFRGDGLVAFFGTAVAHEDDPERGVLAAMAMQRAIAALAEELREQEGIHLSLRVGVNTGEVIVASVGDRRTYSEDTAMGGAIALAARMEQAAEPGTVLVSSNTYRLVDTQFDWQPLGEITVKGIGKPVSVYRPLASRISAESRRPYDIAVPIVGREEELRILIDCIDDLLNGRGGALIVVGDHGMGKSLLIEETRRHFIRREALLAEIEALTPRAASGTDVAPAERTGSPKIREVRGRARSYDQAQPYAIWQDLLRSWLGIRSEESGEGASKRLRELTDELWGPEAANVYPDLARFLGLPLDPIHTEQSRHLDAEGMRQRLFVAIRSWIERLAELGPLIISFSDMHWCDATSLDLLRYCLPLCDYTDLLWVFVFRPERHSPAWEFWHYVETEYPHRLTTLSLEPLDAERSHELIEQMIGEDVLPVETEALIIQKAEGNPFYVQELVRSLIAGGVLVRDVAPGADGEQHTAWRVTQAVTSLSLPDSLQSLLMARIDRLGHTEQLVLQRAAVIGTTFWSRVLDAISPDIPDLRDHLTALQRAQLIAERSRGPDLGVEYMFESKLVRDAAYDSLLSPQRTALHLAIAEYLETECGKDVLGGNQDLCLGILVYHYERAGRIDKELTYTLLNAEHAQAIFANAEACQHYTHALTLLDRIAADRVSRMKREECLAQRFRILLGRHRVHYLLAQFDQMKADARELLALARELTDEPTMLIDALLHQPGVGDVQSQAEIQAGIPMAQEALQLSRQVGDRGRELQSLISIINQKLILSDPSWQPLADEALELARESGEHYYEARLLVGLGGIYAFSDQPERGMEYLEAAAALAMSQGLEDRVVQMSLLNLLGLEFERTGDYYRLLTEYQQERLHASREIGHRPMESQALQACGRITGIYLGDHAGALDTLDDCQAILAGSQDIIYPLFHVAQIQMAQANLEEAHETLQKIDSLDAMIQDRARASLLLVKAMLCNAEGVRAATRSDSDGVLGHLKEAVTLSSAAVSLANTSTLVSRQYEMAALCQATVAYLGLAQTSPAEAEAHLAQALQSAEQAHAIYQTFGFAQIVECVSEEVLLRYSQALLANHQQDLALRYLRRAYDEMMRKYSLIPTDSHFRRTYLEQIPLHREIRAAYTSRIGSILADVSQVWPQTESATLP